MASSACIAPPSSRNKTTTTTSRSSSSSSPFASSSSSAFSPRPSPFLTRPSSPTRLSMSGRFSSPSSSSSSPPSLKFSVDRPISPRRSMSVTKPRNNPVSSNHNNKKIMCACAPTSHPGSFRCSYHKRLAEQEKSRAASSSSSSQQSAASMSLNLRRSAMKNSLVRIGGVEGELAKRTLTTLIRPSSHQQRRREAFQPRTSRFAIMSKAGEV